MKRAARTDKNHTQIVLALRRMGFSVLSLAAVGKGCPDLLISRHGLTLLLEVKNGKAPPSQRRLTPDQNTFHSKFPVFVIKSIEDVEMLQNRLQQRVYPIYSVCEQELRLLRGDISRKT